uniref:Ig-like domain-containing protein n=1 Tax=Scleropages formosus TaxID=113540 RepID=A0A8C9R1A1_SCLFO
MKYNEDEVPAVSLPCGPAYINVCFLSAAVTGQTLTQSEAAVKKPGESHRLTCTFLDSFSSDWIAWIRQPPWKPLGWIVYISDDSFQGRFTISEDVSLETTYLEVTSLQAKDTAVYYCARQTQSMKQMGWLHKNFLKQLQYYEGQLVA